MIPVRVSVFPSVFDATVSERRSSAGRLRVLRQNGRLRSRMYACVFGSKLPTVYLSVRDRYREILLIWLCLLRFHSALRWRQHHLSTR
jgi:hypothetical protein